jgi:uncharacterized protein GlcG (DUF336 family)
MGLTLEEANRVIEGAVAKAMELNIRVSVAVCDAGGRLVAFQRMNNAIWASAYGSQGKATVRARTSSDPSRNCRRLRRSHDHGTGRRANLA